MLGGPDSVAPTGSLAIRGRQIRFGDRLVVDEQVRIEPMLEDAQSGVAGWQPIIDGVEVSRRRWGGPWPDGTYQTAVRATDKAGNESTISAAEPIVVDALPPKITVTGHALAAAGRRGADRSRCGWLRKAGSRWPDVTQCKWLRKAQRRWLRRGWNWLEVSADGRRWNPLIAAGSEPAEEVARASYRLPAAPAAMSVDGADSQLLVRSADGSPLSRPGDGAAFGGLQIGVRDAGAGVERLELRVAEAEGGVLRVAVEATDALGHSRELEWRAAAER